jgi:hypothetical protein
MYPASSIAENDFGGWPPGTWYLALDAEPFGLPPGTNLPGMMTFHRDRTVQIADGGDFGGLPFATRDTAQFGTWRRWRGGVEVVSLFLQADAMTGTVLSWQKVHMQLNWANRHKLVGKVNVYALPCDGSAPFPVFNCSDPIASAKQFTALPPADIPITLKRLPARMVLPD